MKHSKLVFLVFLLIFENPAPFDTKNTRLTSSFLYEPIKSQTRSFVDESGVAYKFIPTKPYDTLVIKSVNRNTVELSHYYHHYIYAEHMLLQADDTVKIRYDGTDKPTYTSLYSDENNRLYGLRRELFDEFMGDDPERMNEQRMGYALNLQRRKNPEKRSSERYDYPTELEKAYYASLEKLTYRLDSIARLNILPEEYLAYYRYYLNRASVMAPHERQLFDTEFAIIPQQYSFLTIATLDIFPIENTLPAAHERLLKTVRDGQLLGLIL